MTRKRRFVVAVLAIATMAGAGAAQETGIKLGSKAPGAMVHTLDGQLVNLAGFLGKEPVVLEFWATWCPLCKQLEPAMKAARARHGDAVTFIGITVPQNQTPERARAFVEKNAMTGTYLFDTDGAAYKTFEAPHTSYLVVIDKKGVVVYTGVGGTQDVETAIAKAIVSQ